MSVAAPAWPRVEDVLMDIRRIVSEAHEIGCLTHRDADADSLGSALAFAESMREMGKRVHVIVPHPIPRLLAHLPGFETIETGEPQLDALFTFDCANLGRFAEKQVLIERTPRVVNIDHHVSNEGFGDIQLIDPSASATGQVVHRLLRELGAPITREAATNLYAALLTDTGGFRHENTTEAALRLAADLVMLGADPGWVAMKSYKSRSISQIRLEGLAIARLETDLDHRLVWSEVTRAMLDEAGADSQESEGIIDALQSLDPMRIAVLFRETGPAATKISVRTRDPFDATALCKPFGGGGHRRAAGAEIAERVPEARRRVLELGRELILSG